jgi:hypothetical protein
MATSSPTDRRPGRTRRPALVLIGALIGLGVLGGTAGTVLGHIGAASSATDVGGWHRHRGPAYDPFSDHGPFPGP